MLFAVCRKKVTKLLTNVVEISPLSFIRDMINTLGLD
jgi:hypothetical protein